MAYSAEFIAKISEKPKHLTPSEKARTFATMRGWEYRPPQADNEKYKNMPSELIMAIPGLSMLLDVTTSDTSIHSVSGSPNPVVITKNSAGFTRRSRRRYSINVSFPEQVFLIPSGSVNFRLDVQYTTQLSTSGAPLGMVDGIINTAMTNSSTTDNLAIGRVQFDIPTFSADPEHLDVTILKFFVESDNNQMNNNSLLDDRGRQLGSTALVQTDLVNYVMEIVKPSTDAPR